MAKRSCSEWVSAVTRRPLIVLAALAVAGGLAVVGAARIEFDDRLRNIFESRDGEFEYLESVFADFGADDNDCVVLFEADDLFSPHAVAALRELVRRLRTVDGVAAVRSIDEVPVFDGGVVPHLLLPSAEAEPSAFERAREAALRHPLVAGRMLSADGRATLIVIRLAGGALTTWEMEAPVAALRAIVDDVARDKRISATLTGVPPVRVEIGEIIRYEQFKFGPVGMIAGVLVIWLIFRRAAVAVVCLGGAFLGATWTLGLIGWSGAPFNVVNHVIPTVVLVIGFADSVHLMSEYRRARAEGVARRAAATAMIDRLWLPCLLTSVTTAIGFGSLWFARMAMIQQFGLATAAGAILALVAVLLTCGALTSTRLGDACVDGANERAASAARRWFDGWGEFVTRRAAAIAIVGSVVTLALAAVALRLRPNNQLQEAIPYRSETRQAIRMADEKFDGLLTSQAIVEWSEGLSIDSPEVRDAIRATTAAYAGEPLTGFPVSILDVLNALPEALRTGLESSQLLGLLPDDIASRFVRPDKRRARVIASVLDSGGGVYEPVFTRLQRMFSEISAAHAGVTVRLTGTTLLAARNVNGMIEDLARSLATAALAIFFVIAVALRSVRLALIALIPNVFPLAVVGALLVSIGYPLQMTSVVVFSVCLGIAVDDTIHLLCRYQDELRRRANPSAAIRAALCAVGPAMATTTTVFIVGFGCVAVSDIPVLRVFSGLCCVAFAAALVGDLVILPALLGVFGGRRGYNR